MDGNATALVKLRRLWYRWKSVFAIAAVLTMFSLVFVPPGLRIYRLIYGNRHPTLSQVERLADIDFPASAVLIRAEMYPGRERLLLALVDIAHKDVNRFLAGLDVQSDGFGPGEGWLEDCPAWYDTRSIRKYKSVYLKQPAGRSQYRANVLVDLDDRRRARVYLYRSGFNVL